MHETASPIQGSATKFPVFSVSQTASETSSGFNISKIRTSTPKVRDPTVRIRTFWTGKGRLSLTTRRCIFLNKLANASSALIQDTTLVIIAQQQSHVHLGH